MQDAAMSVSSLRMTSAVWTALGAPKKILAPMTDASDLAFRLLW